MKVNDIACWKIEIKRNISAPVTSRSDYLFIDKITFLPVRFEIHATWENIQSEYQQLTLKYAKIEEKAPPNRYTPVYPPQYNVEIFTTPLFDYSLLASGTSAPVFDYRDLKGVNYNLKKLKSSKLILLDFWYLGCAPCLASMPEIVSLVQQYKDKGLVVLGINPFDKEDEKKELIQKLVQRKGINYPLLIADNKIVEHYRVKIYPTTYLIAEGKILYANYGYSKESIERLGKIIEEFMGKNFTN